MSKIGIIGGSGLTELESLSVGHRELVRTPYGTPSGTFLNGTLAGQEVVYLARHGYGHKILSHKINYRANLWALKKLGVEQILAIGAVGSITGLEPGRVAIPDQIIDYTYGRENSYFLEEEAALLHLDFSEPYCPNLRKLMVRAAKELCLDHAPSGVYGAAQGPRNETAAEISRMLKDGCDFVGKTGMPEASLARELNIPYAACLMVVNWAAGVRKGESKISDVGISQVQGMTSVKLLFQRVMEMIQKEKKKNGV